MTLNEVWLTLYGWLVLLICDIYHEDLADTEPSIHHGHKIQSPTLYKRFIYDFDLCDLERWIKFILVKTQTKF